MANLPNRVEQYLVSRLTLVRGSIRASYELCENLPRIIANAIETVGNAEDVAAKANERAREKAIGARIEEYKGNIGNN